MPLYEYKCDECGAVFEVLQKISDEPVQQCIKCRGRVHKIISPPAIQFKGSGWYITDYAKKNGSSPAEPKKPTAVSSNESKKTQPPSKESSPPNRNK